MLCPSVYFDAPHGAYHHLKHSSFLPELCLVLGLRYLPGWVLPMRRFPTVQMVFHRTFLCSNPSGDRSIWEVRHPWHAVCFWCERMCGWDDLALPTARCPARPGPGYLALTSVEKRGELVYWPQFLCGRVGRNLPMRFIPTKKKVFVLYRKEST